MSYINITTLALSYLKKDSEEDNGNSGSNKELSAVDVMRKSERQGEWNCTLQTTIAYTELIFEVKWNGAEKINDQCQIKYTWEKRRKKMLRCFYQKLYC